MSINVFKKSKSYDSFRDDVEPQGKVLIETAYYFKDKTGHTAQVSGQDGNRLYDIKGKSQTWNVGADTIGRAIVDLGFEFEGIYDGKPCEVCVKVEGKPTKIMTDKAFEHHFLASAIVDAVDRKLKKPKASVSEDEDIEASNTD